MLYTDDELIEIRRERTMYEEEKEKQLLLWDVDEGSYRDEEKRRQNQQPQKESVKTLDMQDPFIVTKSFIRMCVLLSIGNKHFPLLIIGYIVVSFVWGYLFSPKSSCENK